MPRPRTRAPVAFLIFNRPDLTALVFAEIARARPETLLVVADGPRPGHLEDPGRCAAARAVIERVDWPCDVLTNYSDINLGCAHRPATGLAWVFQEVEEAIILEDDCLPDAAFFPSAISLRGKSVMRLRRQYRWLRLPAAVLLIASSLGVWAMTRHLHPYSTVDSLAGPAMDNYWCGQTVTLTGRLAADATPADGSGTSTYRLVSRQGSQLTVESNVRKGLPDGSDHQLSVTGLLVCHYLEPTDTPFLLRLVETRRKTLE